MAFEDVGSNLTKKMGPFPVWVWGVIIGGAFVVWYWVSQQGTPAESSTDEGSGTVPAPSGDFSTVPVMPPANDTEDKNTNLEWSAQAIIAVTGTGVSLVTAQAAISKYLAGEQLSDAERKIIDNIIAKIGAPPEGVYVPSPAPPKPEDAALTYDTVTTLGGATTRRFGQSLVLTANVRWKNKGTRLTNPSGRVVFIIDGVKRATLPLVNGSAIFVTTPFKGQSSTKDKRWIASAEFLPIGTAKKSVSNQHLVTLS